MSFYRIYRPQVIEEIDNVAVRQQLRVLLSKDRKDLPHAYFFTGPKGTGKTTAARIIAKVFNCEKPTKSGPCGTCGRCTAISNGSSLDVIEMDAASNRGIDEIRLLRERIGLTPVSSDFTIYIIDEVHMLTTEAFNALLKTLEEPPAHAVFVLATTDAHKVPQTIKSRCQECNFHKASTDELLHALARVVKAEKMDIEDNALERIAQIADGSFRDAVKLLEQLSFQKGTITQDKVLETLSLPEGTIIRQCIHHLSQSEVKDALEDINTCSQKGIDHKWFLVEMLGQLERLLVENATGVQTPDWTRDSLQRAIQLFSKAYEEMRYSPIAQLPVELAIVEFCAIPHIRDNTNNIPEEKCIASSFSPTNRTQSTSKTPIDPASIESDIPAGQSLGLLTIEKLIEHWPDFIAATKPYNHSVAGVLRSSRPKAVSNGIVTIEAFYKFHQEKLTDVKTRQILSDVLKKLFGEKVKVEIVLGKK